MTNDTSAEEIVRERIDAIRLRCEAATPGPWYVNDDNEGMPQEYSPFWVISGDSPETYDGEWYMELHCGRHPDAQFIAAAREDIPYLLERVASLTAQLSASQQETRAAVEDIPVAHDMGRCAVCKHKAVEAGASCKKWPDRSCFEWRGPQEAGEEERE